jgi:hypothetical protein
MPELMDIFNTDAFRMVTMTAAVQKRPFVPDFLGQLGIFTPAPIRSIDAAVSMSDEGEISLVPTTPRGAPPYEQKVTAQNVRSIRTPRIAIGDTIYAHELQGIISRAVFQAGDLTGALPIVYADLQTEIAYRLDGPGKLREKVEATKEYMRLGAIQGVVIDGDGSTTLYDWATIFGVSLPAEIDFDLDNATPASGALLAKITDTHRKILRATKTGNPNAVRVIALCGDTFYDQLIAHPEVRNTYLNWQAAVDLRTSMPFGSFVFGNVTWINYRGTDDTTTIGISATKCKFIPVGVPGLFQEVLAPAETFDYVNTPGLPIYVMMVPDRDRNQSVRVETYAYPMYMATRPDVLFSGRNT